MIINLFTDMRTDVIHFNCFSILMIDVHNHFNFDLLTSFFLFKVLLTINEKFKIEMVRQFSCYYRSVYV